MPLPTDVGLWGGASWFVLPHVDARVDLAWLRVGGHGGAMLALQLHAFL